MHQILNLCHLLLVLVLRKLKQMNLEFQIMVLAGSVYQPGLPQKVVALSEE